MTKPIDIEPDERDTEVMLREFVDRTERAIKATGYCGQHGLRSCPYHTDGEPHRRRVRRA